MSTYYRGPEVVVTSAFFAAQDRHSTVCHGVRDIETEPPATRSTAMFAAVLAAAAVLVGGILVALAGRPTTNRNPVSAQAPAALWHRLRNRWLMSRSPGFRPTEGANFDRDRHLIC
ncbi:hypothetical protein Ari01nite_42900 [Paractinoplanes rishiriensis]|uniref:Uncharacterized protein n=1 Tax=Paractinoplanes rishiriensis TaxID=1050105 RepID=A0A919JXS7_9ACTN|nr:hypothetical protein Ari01nite_42900 [Actinoplanes rishiriensis]